MVKGDFKFHAIGQGCFYTGSIKTNSDEFVFVYDCGTHSPYAHLSESIQGFKKQHKKINLLVISHFDEDHINGLKELLSGISCDKVIIPYYNPSLRLSLFASNSYDNDYASFIKSPENYLLSSEGFDVNQVIVVRNDDSNEESKKIESDPIKPNITFNELIKNGFSFDTIESNEDENFKQEVSKLEGADYLDDERKKYYSLPFKLSLANNFWEFVFYTKDFGNPSSLIGFHREIVLLLLKTKDGKISSLFNETFYSTIKGLYRKFFDKNLNYSSLCVYHGPMHSKCSVTIPSKSKTEYTKQPSNNCYGTLLTGDSFLKKDRDFHPFYNYYSSYIDKTFLLQVPHHGSAKNWKLLPNGLEKIKHFIINHGYLREKHPHRDVILDITTHSTFKNLHYNHQHSEINYRIQIK